MSEQQKQKYEQTGVAMTCRSHEEYVRMFALKMDMAAVGPVLDVSGGASSFVAGLSDQGIQAVAADPLYAKPPEDIYAHGAREIEVSTKKLSKLQEQFDWSFYGSLEQHRAMREQALERFIADYRRDAVKSKYIAAELPRLPFVDDTFGVVLCSHFLFLYHEQFDYTFHSEAVRELLRVCKPGGEVRIYPVYTLGWDRYPHMDRLIHELHERGAKAEFVRSELPFIPGSSELLCVIKHAPER
ncbi:class I SAM-dependent methyltransferase [Paenibacillus allorhizosphaerae]|uniref:Methyltransferase type 11 domain-containing protein n=1 Tax=Paenibacillus allorhizosphaerae TaxID=2849866 RepID=A0ABN7TQ19_9BACL|nr:class I SAM-dependent methyltransferase [Paenibacillus allorhizosphaerae]CAG7650664.1 hypothetical protein PAECIP111802_04776 [Paenibacillus allorhizosphaerae]